MGQWFLSIYVWDTGFGPVTKEWLNFKINGEYLYGNTTSGVRNSAQTPTSSSSTPFACSPLQRTDGCSNQFVPCLTNHDVSDQVLIPHGGSINIAVESSGVVNAPCPLLQDDGSSSLIKVKYVLTTHNQPTLLPTEVPTSFPTTTDNNVFNVNGLNFDISELDVWQLLQVSIGVGVLLAAGGVALCKIREKSRTHTCIRCYAVISLGVLGMELSSMLFSSSTCSRTTPVYLVRSWFSFVC